MHVHACGVGGGAGRRDGVAPTSHSTHAQAGCKGLGLGHALVGRTVTAATRKTATRRASSSSSLGCSSSSCSTYAVAIAVEVVEATLVVAPVVRAAVCTFLLQHSGPDDQTCYLFCFAAVFGV